MDRPLVVPARTFHPVVLAWLLDPPPSLMEREEDLLKILIGMPPPVAHPTSFLGLVVTGATAVTEVDVANYRRQQLTR